MATFGHAWRPEHFFLISIPCVCSSESLFSLFRAKLTLYGNTSVSDSHKLCFLSLHQAYYSLNILSPPTIAFFLKLGLEKKIKRNILISHNLAESLEKAVVWGCLFRHSHVNVYSLNSGLLAFTFYSLVPVLQSEECLSRVVC